MRKMEEIIENENRTKERVERKGDGKKSTRKENELHVYKVCENV